MRKPDGGFGLLLLAAALPLALCMPASAQQDDAAGIFRLQSRCVAVQQAYADQLRRTAEQQAPLGSDKYYAILRRGLEGLNNVCTVDGTRAISSSTIPDPRTAAAAGISANDRSATARKGIDRLMREAQVRVVGGQPVPDEFFREVVGIQGHENRGLCTGTAISETAVLTAAHCVCSLNLHVPSLSKPEVVFGPNIGGAQKIVTIDVMRTRLWPGTTLDTPASFCARLRSLGDVALLGNDIAVIFMEGVGTRNSPAAVPGGPFYWRSEQTAAELERRNVVPEEARDYWFYTPARIATPNLYLSADLGSMSVVGYGLYDELVNGKIEWRYGNKMYAPVPIASAICGRNEDARAYNCDPGNELVLIDWVFGKDGRQRDTCRGDSGGPVFAVLDKEYYLVAVTSRSVIPSGECGPGGIYTLLTPKIVAWLREEVGVRIYDVERTIQ